LEALESLSELELNLFRLDVGEGRPPDEGTTRGI